MSSRLNRRAQPSTAFRQEDAQISPGALAVVTGGTGGLGLEVARMLVQRGARVVLAGRDPTRGAAAVQRLDADAAQVRFERLDLANLDSIQGFSERLRADGAPVDILINNAGVMAPPRRRLTDDGYELQFGVNHLGHFALTGRLTPLLSASARIVAVSSGIAASGRIAFDDLQSAWRYRPVPAYAQSKLANLLFLSELQRLSDRQGWGLSCVAAHPGHARTDLIANGMGDLPSAQAVLVRLIQAVASHDAAGGALSLLRAASAEAQPLDYFAPAHCLHQKGPPIRVRWPKRGLDPASASRLWTLSEALTGVRYAR